MNAESEMAGADGLGTELHPPEGCTGAVMYDPQGRPSIQHDAGSCPIHEEADDALDKLARSIGYSDGADGDDEGGVDALIDYKNALEDRCRRIEAQAGRVTALWSEGEDVGDAIAALATACEASD